jgi:hypothetical protein
MYTKLWKNIQPQNLKDCIGSTKVDLIQIIQEAERKKNTTSKEFFNQKRNQLDSRGNYYSTRKIATIT